MLAVIALGLAIVFAGLVLVNYRSIMVDMIGHLIQGRPDDYDGWCYYGTLLEQTGYYLEAYEAFRKAVILSPNYSEAWRKMGDVLLKMGDNDGAAEAYRFSNS